MTVWINCIKHNWLAEMKEISFLIFSLLEIELVLPLRIDSFVAQLIVW